MTPATLFPTYYLTFELASGIRPIQPLWALSIQRLLDAPMVVVPLPCLLKMSRSRFILENRPNISDAEWCVMHEIWQCEPTTSGEITSHLSETTDWTPGTIKTLLHRLVQKGVLDFQRKGNRYLYRSNFSESDCINQASDRLLHTVFQGRPVPMLAYLVQSAGLSGSEVASLREMLTEIQQELPPVALRQTVA
ncbi:MAG: BlaI family penicillinase repressor [Mariniblastus sp.]